MPIFFSYKLLPTTYGPQKFPKIWVLKFNYFLARESKSFKSAFFHVTYSCDFYDHVTSSCHFFFLTLIITSSLPKIYLFSWIFKFLIIYYITFSYFNNFFWPFYNLIFFSLLFLRKHKWQDLHLSLVF